ncbi:WbqC family protein [Lachnospiraceae bacterium 50-23]
MKVGIMQPYFFPYIGYYSLIDQVDKFILLGDVQFIRHGWIERNRILRPDEGWQYISVPLEKHSQQASIDSICIRNKERWKEKIYGQLSMYKWAPYYKKVLDLMKTCIEPEQRTITELNRHSLSASCEYLEIDTPIVLFSEMNLAIEAPGSADEWALNICNAMPERVEEYWNPPGGKAFFDISKYENEGIRVRFQKMTDCRYRQGRRQVFEPWLSIVDVMMFNNVFEIKDMMKNFEFV